MSMKILPVIMCGGAGTRVWPESRETMPKQFIALIGDRSTFQQTVARVTGPLFEAPIVITNHDYRFLVKEQLDEIGAAATIVTEPVRRDSGPAVAVAATLAAERGPETVVAVFAADHVVTQIDAFVAVSAKAALAASRGYIVTLGVKPTEPAVGYGYIRPGAELDDGAYAVDAFVEKPDRDTAERYVASGYLWNSGNFFFRADTMLQELEGFEPEMARAAAATVASAKTDLDFLALDVATFGAAPKKSIDYAVMERTKRAAVVPADIGWSDVGNWDAVWKLSDRDADGNSFHGEDGFAIDSKNVHVRSTGLLTAVVGVRDLVVVTTQDAVLVLGRDQGDRVKELVETLKGKNRREASEHKRMYRPWGYYQSIDNGARYQVKRIVVTPGRRLSLQKHYHRAEHWIVVKGTAEVTCGDKVSVVHENESIYLPIGSVHRLANPGKINLELIEVQTGSYLGEDDIVRLEDVYNRTA
ncbi:MAG: mannose-1-phosphate guanylyltransferase/mannose-6-phosphate isomerase [Pseudomonadota bacterium]|nr:mannose-1-phosphate guanylyltransferase/mannose-6-phosphate isomerase [Pseudomonadota bacterium]